MRLPELAGIIKRRLLVNFRIDPEVMQRHLPKPFRPKLHAGYAVGGICVISLQDIRPRLLPQFTGVDSDNAAHRVVVEWDGEDGRSESGVFINRRDTGSFLNHLAGGRLFPGEHGRAAFVIADDGRNVSIRMHSLDGEVEVAVWGREAAQLPAESIFSSVETASKFFESGNLGISATKSGKQLDAMSLETDAWAVSPFEVEEVRSSYFRNEALFPQGSVQFDSALIMRNIPHVWKASPSIRAERASG